MDPRRLRELLLAELIDGRLSKKYVRPVLDALDTGDEARAPLRDLHEALCADREEIDPDTRRLTDHIEALALRLAQASQNEAAPDLAGLCLPPSRDFLRTVGGMLALGDFMALAKDRRHAIAEDLSDDVRAAIDEEWTAARDKLLRLPVRWGDPGVTTLVRAFCESSLADPESVQFFQMQLTEATTTPCDANIRELARAFDASESRDEEERLLDQLLDQDSDLVVPFLVARAQEPWARLRITVALAHRFPHRRFVDALSVLSWLRHQELPASELSRIVDRMQSEALEEIRPEDFAHRWSRVDASLRSRPEPPRRPVTPSTTVTPPPIPQAPAAQQDTQPQDSVSQDCQDRPSPALVPPEPPPPKAPSVWSTHLKPFFADNWYIFAGLLMLVVGCSIVAYYTWDRHWLWRYTLLPALLGGFTFGLAGLGSWLEKREEDLRGTAASLRAAAIGLLPINFMTVTFLADDPQVVARGLLTAIAATLYLGLFGWGLRRWCQAVFRPIGALLGGALLLINGLVVLRPLALALPGSVVSPDNIPVVIGTGFYLGFAALSLVILVFGRRYLTREIAEDKIVPWFVGGTLLATFVQVMAWVHASLGSLPQVSTYAAMVVLTGGLLLFAERRVLALEGQTTGQRNESFLGYALILLGCLMAQANEIMRVLCFFLAGALWLYQARGRAHQAHAWIGLIFVSLGVASIGILGGFPVALRPLLGFTLAAGFVWTRAFAHKHDDLDLALASHGMRDAALVCASLVAVVGQWNDHTEPWLTALYLGANALLFFAFAHREGRLHLLHAAMVLLVLVLPYAGCVDIDGRSLHGNTMVFGIAILSLLWLLQNALVPTHLTRRARSTVLWFYGSLAVAGMLLRVALERGSPGDLLWYRQAMDYSGPLLMALVLVFATWYSRSLVPAIMAAVIVIILFPELKARFETTFSQLGWGTGIGSSISAFVLTITAFVLRRWPALHALSPGDRLFDRIDFPLRRFDFTLFTWPLLASAVFLVARTETVTLAHNLQSGMSAQTAWAILIAGFVWIALAAYGQALRWTRPLVTLGCLTLGLGIFLLEDQLAAQFDWQVATFWTLIVLQLLHAFYTRVLARHQDWAHEVLAVPTMRVLRLAVLITLLPLLAELTFFAPLSHSIWLVALVGVHLFWRAAGHQSWFAGSLFSLLLLASVLASLAPEGHGWLEDFAWDRYGMAMLWMVLGIQVLQIFSERSKTLWRPSLAHPLQVASLLVVGLSCVAFVEGQLGTALLTTTAQGLLLAILVLQARAWRSSALLLLSLSLGYFWLITARSGFGPELLAPWQLSAFALTLTLLHACGAWLHARAPELLASPRRLGPDLPLTHSWLLGAASGLAFFATMAFVLHAPWRSDRAQLTAPYLGTLALLATSRLWRKRRILYLAALIFAIGNVQLVRLLAGTWLLEHGLSQLHLICLGLGLTLVVVTGIRKLARDAAIGRGMDRASMALAGTTLLLLSTNYIIRHSLVEITTLRFVVSGALAWGASLVFRSVARRIANPSEPAAIACESAYHFGVTIALWCAALLIPPLREPHLALLALSLPAFWFALRAELLSRRGSALVRPYRNSAVTLASLLLALYAFRAAFQMILFPDQAIQTLHYHTGSPMVLLLGLVLIRLHARGAGFWPAFYGGLAIIVGSFFAVTSIPALRPFVHPIEGAAVALALAHFWTLVTTQRSPLRTAIQRLGGLSQADWQSLRTMWGSTLLFGTQLLALIAVVDHGLHPRWVAPLILLAASLVLHHGLIRQRTWYFILAGVEVLLALHADFWIDSWLDRDQILWVLLALSFAGLLTTWWQRDRRRAGLPGWPFAALAGLVGLHVLVQSPWSPASLWAVALQAGMALALPPTDRRARPGSEPSARPGAHGLAPGEIIADAFLLLTPVWLAFFSQVPLPPGARLFDDHLSVMGLVDTRALDWTWPLLCALTAAVAIAGIAQACASVWRRRILLDAVEHPTLLNGLLHLLAAFGTPISLLGCGSVILIAGLLQLAHLDQAYADRAFGLFCALWAALTTGAWIAARTRNLAWLFAVCELCVAALFFLVRTQLTQTTAIWTPLHDVWASLIAAVLLVGMARWFERMSKACLVPLTISILVLPIVGLTVALTQGLGTNTALLVVGMHSLLFSYMGGGRRESPYNILAVMGFTSFVMMLFWTRLELRSLQAYILPVGFGVLVLLQLFRARLSPTQRNGIRLVTVLVMLLSCAWYAILDAGRPIAFNLTLLLFALSAMLLGGFLRIRIYLTLGLTGVFLSLGSILYRILTGLERGSRMTLVGLLVVLTGAALVFGAIYYKTHKARIGAHLDAWRRKLGDWE